MSPDPKRLLGGYATDTLTEEERRELLRAALDDQELFDSIVEEDGLRELLESPGARQEVLAALDTPTTWERVRSWFARPATFGDLAVVGAALVAAFVGFQLFRGETPESGTAAAARQARENTLSPAVIGRLSRLPPHEATTASLEITRASDQPPSPGEALWVCRLSVRVPARVYLLHMEPRGSVSQLLPAAWGFRTLVEAEPGESRAVRELNLKLPDELAPGKLRLVVTPVDLNLAQASPARVDGAIDRMTIIDRAFEVTEP